MSYRGPMTETGPDVGLNPRLTVAVPPGAPLVAALREVAAMGPGRAIRRAPQRLAATWRHHPSPLALIRPLVDETELMLLALAGSGHLTLRLVVRVAEHDPQFAEVPAGIVDEHGVARFLAEYDPAENSLFLFVAPVGVGFDFTG